MEVLYGHTHEYPPVAGEGLVETQFVETLVLQPCRTVQWETFCVLLSQPVFVV